MAFLEIASGGMKGQRFEIDQGEILVGRAAECHIILDDTAVSSRHCMFVREGSRYSIRDLGSTNGTRLNGESVTESRLKPGDIVMVGAVEMLINGDDIEVDESVPHTEPRSQPAPTIVMSSSRVASLASSAGGLSEGFEAKPSRRGLWTFVALVIVAAVAALGTWFVLRLMGE